MPSNLFQQWQFAFVTTYHSSATAARSVHRSSPDFSCHCRRRNIKNVYISFVISAGFGMRMKSTSNFNHKSGALREENEIFNLPRDIITKDMKSHLTAENKMKNNVPGDWIKHRLREMSLQYLNSRLSIKQLSLDGWLHMVGHRYRELRVRKSNQKNSIFAALSTKGKLIANVSGKISMKKVVSFVCAKTNSESLSIIPPSLPALPLRSIYIPLAFRVKSIVAKAIDLPDCPWVSCSRVQSL